MLIDVRTPEEYRDAHHDGAVNIPLDDIETHQFDIPNDSELVLYCRSGGRARVALMILKQRGISSTLRNGTGEY